MSRSLWKGPFSLVKNEKQKETKTKKQGTLELKKVSTTSTVKRDLTPKDSSFTREKQRVWSRASMVLPSHLGQDFDIHTGKGWISLKVVEDMVGRKFGEFALTRKKTIHKHKKVQQRDKK